MSKIRNTGSSTGGTPLTTRSALLSILLGSHPPQLPVATLVDVGALFGIAGGTVRTALSRMVERGDLTVHDGTYALGAHLLTRQAEQDAGRSRDDGSWDGSWVTAVVVADRRTASDRRAFRSRATGAKLGELRADLWMRPANLVVPAALPDTLVVRGTLVGGDDVAIADRLWDLASIDRRSRRLSGELDGAAGVLRRRGSDGIPLAFDVLARALRHLRVEPQLPAALHSPGAGDELRRRYDEVERTFRRTLAGFLNDESVRRGGR